jgi:ribosomal protein S18 acetylase RimI-like enzyme
VIQETTSESQQADLFAVLEQMGHHHPNQPHWYLSMIVVEPSQQGKGYGSALMQPVLMQCNRDGIPAYLESSNPTNIPFYERHGFEVIGTIQTGTLPPIFPMMRQSQSENLEI